MKSKRPHIVPISTASAGILAELSHERGDYVFTTNGETPISGYSNAKERLDRIITANRAKAAGIDPDAPDFDPKKYALPAWTLHDLRRTGTTNLGRAKVKRFIVDRITDHADPTVTGRHYDQWEYLDEKQAGLEAWGKLLTSILQEQPADNVVQLRRAVG